MHSSQICLLHAITSMRMRGLQQQISFTQNYFILLPTRPNMSTEFSYWGYATKAGLTQDLQLAILHKPAANSYYELGTFPMYGILIELLEFATNLGSRIHGLSTSRILKIWIDTLYPACAITCPDRLERAIRRIALPIERKRKQDNLHGYLDRKWKPKVHQSKDFRHNCCHLPLTWYIQYRIAGITCGA